MHTNAMRRVNCMIRFLILAFFLWNSAGSAWGQNTYGTTAVCALDSVPSIHVKVRWAPINQSTWSYALTNGYRVVRYTLFDGLDTLTGADYFGSRVVIDSLVLHLPEPAWDTLSGDTNIVAFAEAAIFGDSLELSLGEGNELINAYNAQASGESRYSFGLLAADRSFYVAQAMGLAVKDTAVTPGHIYDYYAIPWNLPDSSRIQNTPSRIVIDTVGAVMDTAQIVFGFGQDKRVLLQWEIPIDAGYSGFFIERSDNGGTSFAQVNEFPVATYESETPHTQVYLFMDSVSANEATYIYRVRGEDLFNRIGPWSDTIHVYCLPPAVEAAPHILHATEEAGPEVDVSWVFPDSLESEIRYFTIWRSNRAEGGFEVMADSIGKTLRTWTDTSPLPVNYYIVGVTDRTGQEKQSYSRMVQLDDSIGPQRPAGLGGTCSENGLVELNWTPCPDPDTKGYRVFYTYNPDGDFLEATTETWVDTSFHFYIDVQKLNRTIYVKVQALDYRANYSAFSDTVAVGLPDIVPPSPPVLYQVAQYPYGIITEFQRSASADVEKYFVERRKASDEDWVKVCEITGWSPTGMFSVLDSLRGRYTDTTSLQPIKYAYRVVARDSAGNLGYSATRFIEPNMAGLRGEIEDLTASIVTNALGKFIKISWDYTHAGDLMDFQVYRAVNSYPMKVWRTVTGDLGDALAEFSGVLITPGPGDYLALDLIADLSNYLKGTQETITKVRYRVVARHQDGSTSPMSEEVEITF